MARFDRLLLMTLLLTSCVGASVSVHDAGSGVKSTPKVKDCKIPFMRTQRPQRPYVELASLHYSGGTVEGRDVEFAEQKLRERACELGADAVIVTREWVPGVSGKHRVPPQMAAVAILYETAATAGTSAPPSK